MPSFQFQFLCQIIYQLWVCYLTISKGKQQTLPRVLVNAQRLWLDAVKQLEPQVRAILLKCSADSERNFPMSNVFQEHKEQQQLDTLQFKESLTYNFFNKHWLHNCIYLMLLRRATSIHRTMSVSVFSTRCWPRKKRSSHVKYLRVMTLQKEILSIFKATDEKK